MGSVAIRTTAEGWTAEEAFDYLCEKARVMHGIDEYNGSVNNCHLGRCLATFNTPTDAAKKEASQIINRYFVDEAEKRRIDYIDLGVVSYTTRQITLERHAYTAKHKQKYVIRNADPLDESHVNRYVSKNYFDTKEEANRAAIDLADKYRCSLLVKKTMVRTEGNDIVTEISCSVLNQKTKPKSGEFTPVHTYIFFGYAPE